VTLFRALALLRQEEAFETLIRIVAQGSECDAALALEALAIHAHDQTLAARVEAAVAERGEPDIERRFESAFEA
jgi:hypothetical protein